uniref:TIL domain containing protein n=1 Tax=Rhipicephalus zambeziensis TaxID=60191 RepID=A0A224YQH1_9ACAR
MAKIFIVSLLALYALVLPTHGQLAEPQLASIKTGGAGSGSQNPGPQLLPGQGSAPSSRRRCPRGKVYKECVSSTCGEYKCKHLYRFRERKCTADCRSGCFCAWPFFKNNDGRCVPFWQCYTYRFGGWFGRRPSVGMDQRSGQPGGSGSASGPGTLGGTSAPQPVGSSSLGSQLPGGSDLSAGQLPGSSPAVSGWPSQGGWSSNSGLQSGGGTFGPNEYLGNVWGVPTPGYPHQWSFGNGNMGSGSVSGNFVGGNIGPEIGHGAVGNGISPFGNGNGAFGSVSPGLASVNPSLGSGVGGIGSSGFGSVSTGFAGGNTGFGSGVTSDGSNSAGFISSGLGSGPGGVTGSNVVFGAGNITPGAAKGLA